MTISENVSDGRGYICPALFIRDASTTLYASQDDILMKNCPLNVLFKDQSLIPRRGLTMLIGIHDLYCDHQVGQVMTLKMTYQ